MVLGSTMPRIAEFYGIVIWMYYSDHSPPHFHVTYSGDRAAFHIETLEIIEGSLPRRAAGMVEEWAGLHVEELRKNWELARQGEPLHRIAPLE
jgi:hypothetical protein